MAKLTKPCPVNAADVEFLVGKDYNNNVVDVPISSLPDFPEVDVECALQNSPTIRNLKAEDAKLLQLYLALKGRLDDFRILPIHLQKSIEELEELNLCNVKVTLCDVEGDTTFHGNVNVDEKLTAHEIETEDLMVNGTATINNEEVAHSHINEFEADDATIERLTVNESIDDKGTLNVDGLTTTHNIENTGNIANTGDFTNEGNIENAGDIDNHGNFTNDLDIVNHGNISNDGNINNNGDITNEGKLTNKNGIENTGDITNHGNVINDGDITNAGKVTTEDFETNTGTANTFTVNTKLEVIGDTITNGITNTGNIDTDKIIADEAEIVDATITNADIENGDINKATINTANITDEKVINSEIDNLTVNNKLRDKGDLIVDGETDLQVLEVNGVATFREEVRVRDNIEVNGSSKFDGPVTINGDLEVNGSEKHNGPVEYFGDVKFNGNVDLASLSLDGYQKTAEKGAINGYASLDATGKVPESQLPDFGGNGMNFKGGWNASSGSYPVNPSTGDLWYVEVAGTTSGVEYNVGDRIARTDNGTWYKMVDNTGVNSVNNRTGDVTGLEETSNKVGTLNLTNPSATYYTSEKAVVDTVNPMKETLETLRTKINNIENQEATFTDVTVNGDTVINEDLTVEGNTTVENLTVNGETTFKENSTFEKDVEIQGELQVTEKITGTGGADITGGINTDTITTTGDTTIGGDTIVNGSTTLNGGANITGGTTTDDLHVTNNTTLDGSTTMNGGATITGGTSTDTLNVSGDTSIGGDTIVDGSTTLNGGATVVGGTNTDTLNVSGDTTIGGDLNVDGTITGDVAYDNTTSGMEATTVQGAIDELDSRVDDLEDRMDDFWDKPTFSEPVEKEVTTPRIDKEHKILNVWDGTEWISIGSEGAGDDLIYVTQAEYDALPTADKEDPDKHYVLYYEGSAPSSGSESGTAVERGDMLLNNISPIREINKNVNLGTSSSATQVNFCNDYGTVAASIMIGTSSASTLKTGLSPHCVVDNKLYYFEWPTSSSSLYNLKIMDLNTYEITESSETHNSCGGFKYKDGYIYMRRSSTYSKYNISNDSFETSTQEEYDSIVYPTGYKYKDLYYSQDGDDYVASDATGTEVKRYSGVGTIDAIYNDKLYRNIGDVSYAVATI